MGPGMPTKDEIFGRKEARGMRDMCGGIWSFFEWQGDEEGGEWEVCRDEFEEKVQEMMSEVRSFLWQPRA